MNIVFNILMIYSVIGLFALVPFAFSETAFAWFCDHPFLGLLIGGPIYWGVSMGLLCMVVYFLHKDIRDIIKLCSSSKDDGDIDT